MAQKFEESGKKQTTTSSRKVEERDDYDEESVGKKRKRHKEVFPYGNYRSYYGYRVSKDMDEDLRFKVLKEEWFKGKDCLDIGCNSGIMTISIAKRFHCKSMLGIDIDNERIEDAQFNLQKISEREKVARSNTSEEMNVNEIGHPEHERSLLDIVSFSCENFVESCDQLPAKQYDTIICLSVTKWVQLNWGDVGLIKLFTNIWRLLHSGGILILEPQPWKSYCNNRLVTETTAANFHGIMLYPRYFQEILLDKIGFRVVENVTSSVGDTRPGFNRPVLVFRK